MDYNPHLLYVQNKLSDRIFQDGEFLPHGFPYEIMQYTGLKDKNGEKIFEGDILDWRGRGEYNYGKMEYEYEQQIVGPVEMSELYDSDGYAHETYLCWACSGESLLDVHDLGEVIGNIYENEGLLK